MPKSQRVIQLYNLQLLRSDLTDIVRGDLKFFLVLLVFEKLAPMQHFNQ
jgi:hypothetical protein